MSDQKLVSPPWPIPKQKTAESEYIIAIVGTGPSVVGQNIDADLIIAVNSALRLVHADVWFSLDPSKDNKAIIDERIPGTHYIVAFPDNHPTPHFVERFKRLSNPVKQQAKPIRSSYGSIQMAQYWLNRWGCKLGLSETWGTIHTGNSAWGALGWVYLYAITFGFPAPLKIRLYGIDGTRAERATGGYPHNLDHLPLLFSSAVPQLKYAGIAVENMSPISRIDCFPFDPNLTSLE